ncbi:MAG: hypothetical protein GMKNLPBB_01034 [Myxococcota bacterium]|nr:hypothetical protein [Myxococcota bacterium]
MNSSARNCGPSPISSAIIRHGIAGRVSRDLRAFAFCISGAHAARRITNSGNTAASGIFFWRAWAMASVIIFTSRVLSFFSAA